MPLAVEATTTDQRTELSPVGWLVAVLVLLGLLALVVLLVRRIRRDRLVLVNEEIRLTESVDEVAARIGTALRALPKAGISEPQPWQYLVVVKHIVGPLAVFGLVGVLLAAVARDSLALHIQVFQEGTDIVVRLRGRTELSVLHTVRAHLSRSIEN